MTPIWPTNLAHFVFLGVGASGFYRDWEGIARDAVGSLRAEAGRHASDRELLVLVDELSECSEAFRTLWAAHDVSSYRSAVQPFHHPDVGDIDLEYYALEIATEPGLTIVAYTAGPSFKCAESVANPEN
jgi:MmyB-like transcription regulator ligand binding domain